MKKAIGAAFVLVLASSGAAALPEAKKGERPAKEGKVAEGGVDGVINGVDGVRSVKM
jgi:hypothetical protein